MSTAVGTDWKTAPLPRNAEGWIARATEVAAVLATDAAARDKAAATPHAEVRLLKDSGLVTLLGPVEHGGGGQDWPTAYRVVREVAKADGSIGQLLGYHYLWNWAARLVGTREQWEQVEADAARNRWFFGGAVNTRDADVVVRDEGDTLTFTGGKSFSTGSKVSDVTVLEGVLEGTDDHVFAIVPSDSEGLTFHDDWDNIGQRLSESGGVTLDAVRVPWSAAAGYVDKRFRPRVYNTLNVPTIQLVFVSFYLGIAAGALETAATYTRAKSRPCPGDHQPHLRSDRRPRHRRHRRPRPLLAQRPHAHPARPGRLQAPRGRPPRPHRRPAAAHLILLKGPAMATILSVSGSLSATSRTARLLRHLDQRLITQGHEVIPFDVRDLPRRRPARRGLPAPGDPAGHGTGRAGGRGRGRHPVYKAAYSGLLKALLDLLPQYALTGKTVLPLATGGSTAHVLAIDYALRPVLSSMGAQHIVPSWFPLDRDITVGDGGTVTVAPDSADALTQVTDRFSATLGGRTALLAATG